VPKQLSDKAKEVSEAVLQQLQDDTHKIQDIIFHASACPTIQTILVVLEKLDKERMGAVIGQMLMLDSKDSVTARKHMEKTIRHPIASHFVERVLQLCSPEMYIRLYSDVFRHNIVEYGRDASANYVVQQLISSSRHHAQPKLIFDELVESPNNIKSLFNAGRAGVLLKLAEAFHRFSEISKKDKRTLGTSIRDVFMVKNETSQSGKETMPAEADTGKPPKKDHKASAKENQQVFDLRGLLQIKSSAREAYKPTYKKKKSTNKVSAFSPVGCLLVQSLMKFPFDCVDFLFNTFLTLDAEFLVSMGTDSAASRVIEAYLDDSCRAPPKHKMKLIKAMKGHYAKLAIDRCGSHIVEKCYKTANIKVKTLIAEELMTDEKKLDAEKYGKAVLIKCKIGQYKMKKEAWQDKASSIDKKRKMFEDILNEQDDILPTSSNPAPSTHGELGSGKNELLDPVESEMVELLGYDPNTKKRRQIDSDTIPVAEREAKKEVKKQKKHKSSGSLAFILDAIAATKTKGK